ncbi:unnamed protein product [Pleuronectes platessa]|uniref:Uncharacterized protein n=1 Tax=Pleuronectes platessa TaxID=8262 RepID=A0A9N7YUP1_PLEPL|nr:unnamed protein product [Pleuronectes platessa]
MPDGPTKDAHIWHAAFYEHWDLTTKVQAPRKLCPALMSVLGPQITKVPHCEFNLSSYWRRTLCEVTR